MLPSRGDAFRGRGEPTLAHSTSLKVGQEKQQPSLCLHHTHMCSQSHMSTCAYTHTHTHVLRHPHAHVSLTCTLLYTSMGGDRNAQEDACVSVCTHMHRCGRKRREKSYSVPQAPHLAWNPAGAHWLLATLMSKWVQDMGRHPALRATSWERGTP